MHNLEKSAIFRGEWVGYANGVWRVWHSNDRRGPWCAVHRTDTTAPPFYGRTLQEVSDRLAAYAATVTNC
jgi:hypothetical protein